MVAHNPNIKPTTCYSNGCRADECRQAHADYEREQKRVRERPDSKWNGRLVPVEPAQRHLLMLKGIGLGRDRVAKLSGLAPWTINRIRLGTYPRVKQSTMDAILAVTYDAGKVDASEAREHLKFLQSKGVGYIRIANKTGIDDSAITSIRNGKRKYTTQENVNKILGVGTHMFRPNQMAVRASEERAS